jgi:hypothetical protein
MNHPKCLLAGVLGIGTRMLAGCADIPTSNFDDSTLIKGKPSWETKRHADDWIQPVTDGVLTVGACILVEAAEAALDNPSISRAGEPGWLRKKESRQDPHS